MWTRFMAIYIDAARQYGEPIKLEKGDDGENTAAKTSTQGGMPWLVVVIHMGRRECFCY